MPVASALRIQLSKTAHKPSSKLSRCSPPPIPPLPPLPNEDSAKRYVSQLSQTRHPLLCQIICQTCLIYALSPSTHEPDSSGQGRVVQRSNSLSPSTYLTMLPPPSQLPTTMIPSTPKTHAAFCITSAETMLPSSF